MKILKSNFLLNMVNSCATGTLQATIISYLWNLGSIMARLVVLTGLYTTYCVQILGVANTITFFSILPPIYLMVIYIYSS
jgi:spore maturation protein SpmA